MTITSDIVFKGSYGEETCSAVIDTGASTTVLPSWIVHRIGASDFQEPVETRGFNGAVSMCGQFGVHISFPVLDMKGGLFRVLATDEIDHALIGIDVLRTLGVSIDTRTHQLAIKNEVWEQFKTTAGYGAVAWVGYQAATAVGAMFTSEPKCGATLHNGGACQSRPLKGRKRCGRHRAQRV